VFVLARSRIPHAWARARFFAITIWITRMLRFEERLSFSVHDGFLQRELAFQKFPYIHLSCLYIFES